MNRPSSSLSGRILTIAMPIVTAACGGGQASTDAARESELVCRQAAAHVKATADEILSHAGRASDSEVTRALRITGDLVPSCTKAVNVPVSELQGAMDKAAKTDAAIAANRPATSGPVVVLPRQ